MHKLRLVFACVACVGQGQRVGEALANLHAGMMAGSERRLEVPEYRDASGNWQAAIAANSQKRPGVREDSAGTHASLRPLALLLASAPVVAYNPPSLGLTIPRGNPSGAGMYPTVKYWSHPLRHDRGMVIMKEAPKPEKDPKNKEVPKPGEPGYGKGRLPGERLLRWTFEREKLLAEDEAVVVEAKPGKNAKEPKIKEVPKPGEPGYGKGRLPGERLLRWTLEREKLLAEDEAVAVEAKRGTNAKASQGRDEEAMPGQPGYGKGRLPGERLLRWTFEREKLLAEDEATAAAAKAKRDEEGNAIAQLGGAVAQATGAVLLEAVFGPPKAKADGKKAKGAEGS